ncbi:MAG: PTS sugar transporter subunit IIA [Verrucomicrobiota bacterium]|nr:PTS sugar transporter subunit IIA [Verrucomicrobiota bacterium]
MDLKVKDIAELLQVSEKTIYRWINKNKIPYYKINHQYRFKTDDINKWSVRNKYDLDRSTNEEEDFSEPVLISKFLKNGGIFYNIEGENLSDVLLNSVELLNLPVSLDKKFFLSKLEVRESMTSTAVGRGIAFPHPRNPLIRDIKEEALFLCFLHKPIEFNALDKIPVSVLFILLSFNQTRHLRLMSKLSYLCRQKDFTTLIKKQPLREDLFSLIERFEQVTLSGLI